MKLRHTKKLCHFFGATLYIWQHISKKICLIPDTTKLMWHNRPYLSNSSMVRSRNELFEVGETVRHGVCKHQFGLNESLASLLTSHLQVLHKLLPVVCQSHQHTQLSASIHSAILVATSLFVVVTKPCVFSLFKQSNRYVHPESWILWNFNIRQFSPIRNVGGKITVSVEHKCRFVSKSIQTEWNINSSSGSTDSKAVSRIQDRSD